MRAVKSRTYLILVRFVALLVGQLGNDIILVLDMKASELAPEWGPRRKRQASHGSMEPMDKMVREIQNYDVELLGRTACD